MSTLALDALIREASTELGSEACRNGKHDWVSEGGRGCPKDYDFGLLSGCSQTVYVCRTCGTYDYGEPGGPGRHDCVTTCRHRPMNGGAT